VVYDFPLFLQTPPADVYMPEIPVTYKLELVSFENVGDPRVDIDDFAYVYANSKLIIQSNDMALVGNYTVNLVGSYSFSYGADSRDERV